MDDTQETIRHQMEETKSQLSEKLESLELQVSESVQSTGTAVAATAEAVQETVQTLSGAVKGAVQSVSNAFDVRRQIDRHPWLVIGGCVVSGYLAVEFLASKRTRTDRRSTDRLPPQSSDIDRQDNATQNSVSPAIGNEAAAAAAVEAYKSGQERSSWHQLRDIAMGAMIGVAQDVASRYAPLAVDFLTGEHAAAVGIRDSETAEETSIPSRQQWSREADQRSNVASSFRVRSDNSF